MICSEPGCGWPRWFGSLCRTHYFGRYHLRVAWLAVRKEPAERFWPKITRTPSGCWECKVTAPNGYGRLQWKGEARWAHRAMYELLVEPIPAGLEIDHLCRNRACVNPAHLEVVSRQENALRAMDAKPLKTHCPHGHPYDATNTGWQVERGAARPTRFCRACSRRHKRDSRRRAA